MAGSGLAKLNKALTPLGSQTSDEDIINEQLQNEIEFQVESKKMIASKKSIKRKSRDRDDFDASDTDGSPRKKRSEKTKKRREKKRLSKLQHGQITSPNSPTGVQDRLEELTGGTSRTTTKTSAVQVSDLDDLDINESGVNGEQNGAETGNQHHSNLSGTGRRTSLGSNREALLQSILKGCGPEKSNITKNEQKHPSRSETGESPVASIVSKTPEPSSKEKSRRKVSMVPILPEGYKPDPAGRFYCPIESCEKVYSRRSTLGEHMNTSHAGKILKDNLDGTMTIISPDDYHKAISSDKNQMIVEIPSVPLPRKARKVHHSKVDGNKTIKALSATELLHQGSRDRDATYVTKSSGAKASNPRDILHADEKTPVAVRTTPSKIMQLEQSSSEYETSDGKESSDIDDGSKPQKSTSRLSITQKSQPSTSTGSPSRASTTVKSIRPGRYEDTLSMGSRTAQRESSKDGMEDWEIEPGVIVGSASESSSDSETEHNTAYSSVYISSAEAGVKLSGVHFQVIRIAPGCTAPGPNVPYLRVCSVAAGKVLVRVGEKSFSIGANGMWRIKAGEYCTVGNRHYSEAIIHVSTIKSD